MNWHSSTDFFQMGGYGLYVWGSYGAALLLGLSETLLARRRHAKALNTLQEDTDL